MYNAEVLKGTEIHGYDFSAIHYFGVSCYFANNIDLIVVKGDSYYDDYYCEERQKIIGCIHLQRPNNQPNVIWMNYISIDPDQRGKGIAKVLVNGMIDFIKSNYPERVLQRSAVSKKAPAYIKPKIDDWLDSHGIKWTQEES